MSGIMLGKVIKSGSNLFIVDTEFGIISCSAHRNVFDDFIDERKEKPQKMEDFRKGARKNRIRDIKLAENVQRKSIIAGDICKLIKEKGDESWTISKILPRINTLIRPKVANIDQIIVVLAPKPEPDLLLIDKLIINAKHQGIAVVLCVNKSDLESDLYTEICLQYNSIADKIISVSAKFGDITSLKNILIGKLSAFAGQSAVGKSSLVNALTKTEIQKTDTLSNKIDRGKNTTTRAEIIKLSSKTYIIDTPGFSALDIHGIDYSELDLYYPEYVAIASDCKYPRCTHTVEPNCKVKELVMSGMLSKKRYDRYCILRK